MISHGVASRTAELGIRRALGAGGETVVRMVMLEGARVALQGVALGLVAALALTPLIRGFLHDVSPAEPWTYASVTALLGSWWALIPALTTPLSLMLRIVDEEKQLTAELPGYADYAHTVRWRLIPGVW